jgi:hypothetical protein
MLHRVFLYPMPYLPLKTLDDILHVRQVCKSRESFLLINQYCLYLLISYVSHLVYFFQP